MAVQPQIVGGRYKLIREIGSGGMGRVYEGYDQNLRRRVAVKFTHPSLDEDPGWDDRFLREAELMAQFNHPGLTVIHDVGTGAFAPGGPERPYLVMEFIEGKTLDTLLEMRGAQPVGVVANLGAQAAAALAAAHRNRIYHRDLKPSNLMLCADGTVKVLDFGLAVAPDSGRTRHTSHGQSIGTPAYMAPEQVELKPVLPQTDLYSLGLVLYELLTGDRVMTGTAVYTLWQQQMEHMPPDIRRERTGVPVEMARLIMSMLAKSPDARPDDAATVNAVLLRYATDLNELPEVNDNHSPARMYALAVGSTASPRTARTVVAPSNDRTELVERHPDPAPARDFSRADLQRAVRRARDLADDSRYDPAIHELRTVVEYAAPLLGSRDADVVEARVKLADLRFENADYTAAADLYRGLIDDLTAERGPYDDQVMYCQRQLATCHVHLGDTRNALTRLKRLHSQMALRYGEQDRRVVDLAAQINHIKPS
ncbi:protein kinase domain-containing protein [Nocardia sp. CA-136227]|uniref:serine/threonine-protein kinase n=1 Tax=Nocardia sp. CA-136227 TaxID=3239979 RepID=UPI003D96BF41